MDDLTGVANQGGDVARHVHLALADTEDQRRAVTRDHDPIREVCVQDRDAERSLDLVQGVQDLLLERSAVGTADQMAEHLRVGLGHQRYPEPGEPVTQRGCVVDDPVVDDRDLP